MALSVHTSARILECCIVAATATRKADRRWRLELSSSARKPAPRPERQPAQSRSAPEPLRYIARRPDRATPARADRSRVRLRAPSVPDHRRPCDGREGRRNRVGTLARRLHQVGRIRPPWLVVLMMCRCSGSPVCWVHGRPRRSTGSDSRQRCDIDGPSVSRWWSSLYVITDFLMISFKPL